MSKRGRAAWIVALVVVVAAARPPVASAQWYLGEAFGGNHSSPATVFVRTGPDFSLAFHDVQFAAKPWTPRRYFVIRGGYAEPKHPHVGFEVEYIHYKALADVDQSYAVTVGEETTLTPADAQPMSKIVQAYHLNSGINLVSVLYVWRNQLGTSPVTVVGRAGGGVTFPNPQTAVLGLTHHGYEFGGPGAQGAIGLEWRVWPLLALTADYKLTYVRPSIHIAGGRSWTALTTQHGTAGLVIYFRR